MKAFLVWVLKNYYNQEKKQLEDLVSEVKRKPYKHRSDSPSRSVSDNKRPCFNKPSVPVNTYNSSAKP